MAAGSEDEIGRGVSVAGLEKESRDVSLTLRALGMERKLESHRIRGKKVTVVGVGQVGMACAFAIVNQGLVSSLALVDVDEKKLRGEALDLKHGLAFAHHVEITASTDYAVSRGSHVVVITAGARQRPGESRLKLLGRNLDIFKSLIPPVAKASPDATLVIVSNPCDIMTHIAATIAGEVAGFPPERVLGTGTSLDSSRFRALVAERLGVATRSVHGYVIGEHGDSSVPVWSSLNVGGVRLQSVNPDMGTDKDPEHWGDVHKAVVQSAYEVIQLKGMTNFAIGLTVASVVDGLLRDTHRIMPVSTPVRGLFGIEEDVCLSVPCVLGSTGVLSVIPIPLSGDETERLRASAKAIFEAQSSLDITA